MGHGAWGMLEEWPALARCIFAAGGNPFNLNRIDILAGRDSFRYCCTAQSPKDAKAYAAEHRTAELVNQKYA
jgi:hypothetical protein